MSSKDERCLSESLALLACAVNRLAEQLQYNNTKAILHRLAEMEEKIMSAFDDVKAELGTINGVTNEIAADIDEMIGIISTPGGMTEAQAQEVLTGMKDLSATLKNVASKYPVPTPPPAP